MHIFIFQKLRCELMCTEVPGGFMMFVFNFHNSCLCECVFVNWKR